MELTLQANKSSVFIKNYENGSFYIDEKIYKHNMNSYDFLCFLYDFPY